LRQITNNKEIDMKSRTFRKLAAGLGLALLSATPLSAQNANDSTDGTSVWKVTKNGDTVFIGGTIHILPVTEFPLPTQFTDIYQQSDTVVFEAELPDPTDIAAQQQMMMKLSYQNGETLKDTLTDETFEALDQYLSTFGANANQLASFKPGFVTTMLVTMEAQRAQMAGEGVDAYFTQLAKRDNKEREYLESLDFQINMLANLGDGEEERFISETLATLPELKSELEQTIKAWRKGDTEALNKLVIQTFKQEAPESYDDVFTKRNMNWIPQIEAMFGDDDKEFVLVGAGHLVGEDNVLKLLEQKGYSVKQL
jgi:uncharacterized protein YbaP (TraB family)